MNLEPIDPETAVDLTSRGLSTESNLTPSRAVPPEEGVADGLHVADEFVEALLEWYVENGRHDLPWRDPNASPFEIVVAELMLQQTSAGQVRGVYEKFVERYPTAGALLAAPEAEVAEAIEPLGLRKRTAYFRRASAPLLARHDGCVPDSRSELRTTRIVAGFRVAVGQPSAVTIALETPELAAFLGLQIGGREECFSSKLSGIFDPARSSGGTAARLLEGLPIPRRPKERTALLKILPRARQRCARSAKVRFGSVLITTAPFHSIHLYLNWMYTTACGLIAVIRASEASAVLRRRGRRPSHRPFSSKFFEEWFACGEPDEEKVRPLY